APVTQPPGGGPEAPPATGRSAGGGPPQEAEWLHIGNPGSGGLVNEARDGSEGEVWSVGPDLWGSHRNDPRLCVGWLDNLRHDPNDDQRGGFGESGGDLRRPIYEATEPSSENQKTRGVN